MRQLYIFGFVALALISIGIYLYTEKGMGYHPLLGDKRGCVKRIVNSCKDCLPGEMYQEVTQMGPNGNQTFKQCLSCQNSLGLGQIADSALQLQGKVSVVSDCSQCDGTPVIVEDSRPDGNTRKIVCIKGPF